MGTKQLGREPVVYHSAEALSESRIPLSHPVYKPENDEAPPEAACKCPSLSKVGTGSLTDTQTAERDPYTITLLFLLPRRSEARKQLPELTSRPRHRWLQLVACSCVVRLHFGTSVTVMSFTS